MKKTLGAILSEGLIQGYGVKEGKAVERAGFTGKSSHIQFPNGVYHDEWFVPLHLGGGQELVQGDHEMFTRLYAGGTPDPNVLKELGIVVKDVSRYLKRKIVELGDKTRLLEDCNPEPDEDWQYTYKVTSKNNEIPVTTSLESIFYNGKLVHIHAFIFCPIK